MNYRSLGRTGLKVSEIGFGAWGIGRSMWIGAEDDESLRALHHAIDLGLNFIDTALAYGDGHSEQLVGRVLKQRDERTYVATKVPPKNMQWPALAGTPYAEVFPTDWVLACTGRSLRNLDVDQLDLQQFHVWLDEWAEEPEWHTTVQLLKDRGLIRHFGISINDHQPENALAGIRTGLIDTVQVIYNIFDQTPQDELLPACQAYDVGVLARVPLDEGGLTGKITPKTTFPKDDWRNNYFRGDRKQQVYERAQALEELLVGSGVAGDLPEAALRFCISHPAVSTVIPGMRKIQHVEANCAASDQGALPAHILEGLKAHVWPRNFYE